MTRMELRLALLSVLPRCQYSEEYFALPKGIKITCCIRTGPVGHGYEFAQAWPLELIALKPDCIERDLGRGRAELLEIVRKSLEASK